MPEREAQRGIYRYRLLWRYKIPLSICLLVGLGVWAYLYHSEVNTQSWINSLHDENSDKRSSAAQKLAHFGYRGIDPLIQALQDTDAPVRARAALSLGEITRTIRETESALSRVVEALIVALHDNSAFVRANAAESLGTTGSQQATEPLIEALADNDIHVRVAAANSLIATPSPHAVSALIEAAKSGKEEDPARALVKIGAPAVDGILDYLRSEAVTGKPNWRLIKILGEIKDPRSVELLIGNCSPLITVER